MLERPPKLVSYRFDQLADQINDRVMPDEAEVERYVGLEHLDPDSLRIRRWGDTSEVESTKLLFQPGDIIFGKRRVYTRKVAVADFKGICSAHAMVLRAKEGVIIPDFLPFFMQSDIFMERALSISVGSLSPTINWKALAKEEFFLPPIQEQARLVEALGAAEQSFSSLTSAAMAAESIEKAYGEKYLGATVCESGIELGEICKEDIQKTIVKKDIEYRVAGVFNKGAGLYLSEVMPGSKTRYKQLHVLKAKQIVMRKLTAWEGSIAVVPEEFSGSVVSPEFPTLLPDHQRVRPDYLKWLFRQPPFWREMKAHCRGTAVRRSRLHQRDLMKIRIVLPDLAEQDKIISELDRIRAAAETARSRAAEVKSIFNKILSESLSK